MNSQTAPAPVVEPPKEKLRPCCACPDTKKIRDQCIFNNGEESCKEFIEAHKACLRSLGFNPQ